MVDSDHEGRPNPHFSITDPGMRRTEIAESLVGWIGSNDVVKTWRVMKLPPFGPRRQWSYV